MRYFFIVGCQRSGTTVVQQALNRHSRVVIPPETGFFTHFLGHTRTGQRCHLRSLNRDLGIELPAPRRRVRHAEDVRWYFDELARQYLKKINRPDASLFGEKTPHHILRLPRLARYFPNAHVILVYRDGRDVALSLSKVPWFSNNLEVCFGYWLKCCRWQRWALRCSRLSVHCVRYERFVALPTETLEGICSFLGIEYEESMQLADGSVRGLAYADQDWMALAGKPISPTRIRNWQRELTTAQLNALERWGWRTLTRLGYQVSPAAHGRAAFGVQLRGWAMTMVWRGGNALRVLRRNLLGVE